MSASISPGTVDIDHISLSSFAKTMPLTTKKGPSKEVIDISIKDSTLTGVPILSDTQCFIDKYSTITWLTINDVFNMKNLP